jgi:hypothetical protein
MFFRHPRITVQVHKQVNKIMHWPYADNETHISRTWIRAIQD